MVEEISEERLDAIAARFAAAGPGTGNWLVNAEAVAALLCDGPELIAAVRALRSALRSIENCGECLTCRGIASAALAEPPSGGA